jgi:hypothetical protein
MLFGILLKGQDDAHFTLACAFFRDETLPSDQSRSVEE